ncbi:PAQR family membrane homeostasis protein TrhA [Myxococcus sp. Y35]|uniref:PAQR family membrane homeostasis protein TrhA n=1 Tax=Pseudomyxococcus flavus TaxID=3115648 RepID=UPI003CEB02E7
MEKPRLRGVLHQFAATGALGAGCVLVSMAPTDRAAAAAAVYALSLVALFAVSATYHRVNWSTRGRTWMRRMDHASIFILIAGTYTPVALLGISGAVGNRLLAVIWAGALAGILQSLFWIQAPKVVTAAMAIAVGWTLVPYLDEARQALSGPQLALILAGGVAYTAGALAYALKRPDLRPGVFGYHELFHAMTLVGAGLHFAVVLRLVRAAGA